MRGLTDLTAFHHQHQMAFRTPRSRLDFTVHQPDDPAIPAQAFKQSNLVHIPAHRFCVRLIERDAFDSIYLVRIVHHTVDARRAALANQIEPRICLFAHNEVARLHLHDWRMSYLVLASYGVWF